MKIVQVTFIVKPDSVQAFIDETRFNVENSRKEAGVERFEFYRIKASGNVFMLFEVYRLLEDQLKHRETAHFLHWRGQIAALLEKPYTFVELEQV